MANTQWHWQKPGTTWRGCGIYHITLTQSDRSIPLLGRLTDSSTAEEATIERTELGNAIVELFLAIPTHRKEVQPLAFCLMPDHFHGVIYVTQEMQSGIKSLVRGFWQGCKKLAPVFHEMPHIVPLAGKGQLKHMYHYVHDNPRRAWLKRAHPDLFHIKRRIHVLLSNTDMEFSAMGNMFLLDWPLKQLVECSRTITQETYNTRLQEVMESALQGYVTITAAINEAERNIARTVREAGYPVIILLKDGFPAPGSERERFFKPQGVYFDTCAAGQLLLLEPVEDTFTTSVIYQMTQEDLRRKAEVKHHDYVLLPPDSLRYRYVALNNIGRLLANGSITQSSL